MVVEVDVVVELDKVVEGAAFALVEGLVEVVMELLVEEVVDSLATCVVDGLTEELADGNADRGVTEVEEVVDVCAAGWGVPMDNETGTSVNAVASVEAGTAGASVLLAPVASVNCSEKLVTVVTATVVNSSSANVLTISAIFTESVVVGCSEVDGVLELSDARDVDVSVMVVVELEKGCFC